MADLRTSLPEATIYVYDNCSSDATAAVAERAGAIVRREDQRGKGNVVRRAFADIDADVYLMIDGDDTYDAHAAPEMIDLLLSGPYDHVLGVRTTAPDDDGAYRAGHETGNRLINGITGWVFGSSERDMLSGFRVMSRRFVKSFPAVSREFELETELTVHTLALRVPHASHEVGFRDRPPGSESKLRTYRDGFRILGLIANLARHEKPLTVYSSLAVVAVFAGFIMGLPVLVEYLGSGLVPRIPSLFVSLILGLLGLLLVATGLAVDGIKKMRHELARLQYLNLPSLPTLASEPAPAPAPARPPLDVDFEPRSTWRVASAHAPRPARAEARQA